MADTQRDNAFPTGELRDKLWRDRIKPWVDFRSYVRQRAVILKHPDLDFPPEAIASTDWKGPLSFAIQGTVIIALLVGFIGTVFSKFVAPRPTAILKVERDKTGCDGYAFPIDVKAGGSWPAKQERIEKDIFALQAELDIIQEDNQRESFCPPVPYSLTDWQASFILSLGLEKIPKDDAIQKYKEEIATLNEQLHQAKLGPYKEEARKFLAPVVVAITFLLAAYLFRLLINVRRRYRSETANKAHLIYLYFITANLFWVNLLYSLLMTIRENVEKFFPPTFEDMVHDIDLALRSIDHPFIRLNPAYFSFKDYRDLVFTLLTVGIVLWGYLVIRRVSALVRPVLGLEQAARWWNIYTGERKIRKDILAANLVSSVIVLLILFITMYVYAVVSLSLPKL